MPRIVATPEELDAQNGWWKWKDTGYKGNPDSADKWLRPAGYVKEEVKAALRRSNPLPGGLQVKRDRHGRQKPLKYTLPRPTLAASSAKLAKATLGAGAQFEIQWPAYSEHMAGEGMPVPSPCKETFTGPRAAEQYIKYRRAQLGLSNDLADPEMDALELQEVAA